MRIPLYVWLIITFIAALAIWIAAPLIVGFLLDFLYGSIGEPCVDAGSTQCDQEISRRALVGDSFGAINSLFSALALFAVSVTLWVDGRSRRQQRKPLLVSSLSEDSLSLEEPKVEPDSTKIKVKLVIDVSNQTVDAALNVVISVKVQCSQGVIDLGEFPVGMPIVGGMTQAVECEKIIEGVELERLLADLTTQDGEVSIEVSSKYFNLELAGWLTTASYKIRPLSKIERRRLNAVRGEHGDIPELWAGNAKVDLMPLLRAGSWKHSAIK